MAKGNETTTKFKVDISELKKSMQEARKQVAYANSEFKATASTMDDWSKSSEGLGAKLKQLNSNLKSQEAVLAEYEKTLEEIKKFPPETSRSLDERISKGSELIMGIITEKYPGFDPEVVDYCLEKGILVLPGCITPSEVAQAVKRGLEVVKFFSAEQFGGVSTLKALAAPYVNTKFMPTGGISAKNLKDYLSFKRIVACGGSWMVKGDMIAAGEFDKIKEMTAEAVALVKEIRG